MVVLNLASNRASTSLTCPDLRCYSSLPSVNVPPLDSRFDEHRTLMPPPLLFSKPPVHAKPSAMHPPVLSPLELDLNIGTFESDNQKDFSPENIFQHSEPMRHSSLTTSASFPSIPSTAIPRLRKKGTSKVTVVQNALDFLRSGDISPTEMFTMLLDESQVEFALFRKAFYADRNSRRIEELLDRIWSSTDGNVTLTNWMMPHAIKLVCGTIS